MSTHIPNVKRALKQIAEVTLTDVQVSYGEMVRNPARERFYLAPDSSSSTVQATFRAARLRVQEDSLVGMTFVVVKATEEDAEQRAAELAELMLDVLYGDPKLSAATDPPAVIAVEWESTTMVTLPTDDSKFETTLEMILSVKGRNT